MKKIFKLRIEIIIIIIFSIILSFLCTILIGNVINMFSKTKYNPDIEDTKVKNIVEDYRNGLILKSELEDIVNNWDDKYINVYMVNATGEVIAAREKGIKLIDLDEITNNEVIRFKNDKTSQLYGKFNIGSDEYIIYYYFYYNNDSQNATIMIILTIIFFYLFIHSRISYIKKINDGIKDIAEGQFNKRIPLKYNNELRTLAENINIMANKLQESDDKKKDFITNISHDLRTPLTTMLGYLNIIENNKYDNIEELNKYIKIINNKGCYLKLLMDDFFTFSKLNSNDVKMSYCTIDCKLFVNQIIMEEKTYFKSNNLTLNLEFDKNETYFTIADSELASRAFYNILNNAFKYSKCGTEVKVILEKENHKNNRFIVISILNIPYKEIDNNELQRLFERLYKSEKERSSEGSGLGLTITEKIMKLHNGFIKGDLIADKIQFKLGFLEKDQ